MKQCPKCNYTCADEDVICKNCGYLFEAADPIPTPEGGSIEPQGSPVTGFNAPSGFNASSAGQSFSGEPRKNGMSTASLVLGIIGVVTSCCGIGGIIGIVSLILGIISKKNIKESNGALKGDGLSMAGIILSIVAIAIGFYMIISFAINGPEVMNQVQDILNNPGKYGISSAA